MDQTTTTKSLTRVQADDIFKIGLEFYEEQAKKSNLSREFLDEIPRFSLQELIEGKVLGTGGFCSVSEVRGLRLIDEDIGDESVEQESFELGGEAEVDPGDMESRQFIANHSCRNNGDARYAIKKLKQQIIDDQESFLNGMVDLATETDFLSVMDHPNIIRLRGIAKEDMFSSNYFLILDRLYDTLESRIPKWRQRKHAISGIFACFSDKSGKKKEKMKEERMEAGLDLAAAISYFHQNKIIHRDLKSENIGFDVRGDIKIFDLGLAKEIPKHGSPGDLYNFTGMCGTPRYMAPEVGLGKPYNETSDVYSLALLFWEIMHLYQPYIGFSGVNNFRNEVWKGPQIRPMISKKVPFELKVLLERAWSPDLTKRPSASEFEGIVRTNCLALNKSMRVTHDKRRSTFVLVSGGKSTRNEKLSTLPVLTENNFQNDNAVES